MIHFSPLFKSLDETAKTSLKVKALEQFFNEASDIDKLWAIALLARKRPKRVITTSFLREWASEQADIPLWLFEESYHVVGDLAETIALLVPQNTTSERTLSDWIFYLEELRGKDQTEIKAGILDAWSSLNSSGRFIFNKLITGGFRIGVSQKLMIKGLAKSTGLDEKELTHKLMGNWNPFETTFEKLVFSDDKDFDNAKPYPFFLAYPVTKFKNEIGNLSDWIAEYKWDGIRGQVIQRNNEISVWSRGEELVTQKFPELIEMANQLPSGTVLDGEIVPWKENKVLDFQVLQTRIGRKNVTKKHLTEAPASLIAYDILEYNHKDIRHLPQVERRALLDKLIDKVNDSRLMLSETVSFKSYEELEKYKNHARSLGAEGLMLKRKNGSYEIGRKKGNWYKWKVDPYTIDAVLTYAMRGHGRRANLYTDYTFGLWQNGELVTFAKAYSGLTDEEFIKVDAFVKKNSLEKFGPVRRVKPELVFELAFEGIALSKRHKSGIAVRFPRMHHWRHDKKPEDANTLEDLKSLLTISKDAQKTT